MNQKEIDQLKCQLYGGLLQNCIELTDNELDIMCHLSRDIAVQKRLESSLSRKIRKEREKREK